MIPVRTLQLLVSSGVITAKTPGAITPKGDNSLTATPIVDFTGGYESGKWSPLWEDFYCDWRHCWFNERIEPPSWIIGDEVVLSGAKGILFKSRLTPNGTNLVLYTENFDPTDRLDVFDPHNALPKNQSSWG